MTYFFPTKRANGDIIFDGRGPDMGLFDFTLAEALNQDSSYFYFSDDLDVRQKSAGFLKSVFIFSSTLGASDAGFEKRKGRILGELIQYLQSIQDGDVLISSPGDQGDGLLQRESKVDIVWGGDVITQQEIALS